MDDHSQKLPTIVTRKRIVRRLDTPGALTTGAAAPAARFHETLQPKSAFWRAQTESLRLADASLAQLHSIDQGVGGLSAQVGELEFPSAIGVTTSMSAADAQVFGRLTVAVEKVADNLAQPKDGCGELDTLTPRAFSLVARLTTLAAHLMDRDDVSATSTLQKLDQDAELIAQAHDLLAQSGLDDVLMPFASAFDRDPFTTLATSPSTDRSPPVFAELQERAALLLAIKCIVATGGLEGPASDWPPTSPAQSPSPTPSPPSGDPTNAAAGQTRTKQRHG
jgi:hypothetical protein